MTVGFPSEWVTGDLPCPGTVQPAVVTEPELLPPKVASGEDSRHAVMRRSPAVRGSGSAAAAGPAETHASGCVV